MYIPGRWRTGSRPLRTVMSLAAYATRAYLVHSPTGGRTDDWGKGVRPGPETGKTAGQGTENWCRQCTRRTLDPVVIRPISRRFALLHAHAHGVHHTASDDGRGALHDRALEVAQLRGPDGVVDGDQQHAIAQRHEPRVHRHVGADHVRPVRIELRVRVPGRQSELGADRLQRVRQRYGLIVRVSRAHAASSTRPASTRSMRSAEMPRGTAPAVVTSV